jgi:hypothetical protein
MEDGLIPRPPAWDLRDRLAAKFNIHRQERSVGKLLKKLDFSSISARPMHQTNLGAQEAFKKNFANAPRFLRGLPAG